ncbi:histidine kinase [Paracrocinitomix mangrovi]|uniref:ligand-binding sensor domain-containing protein n=1 Tax=Paracrocinitomix mangrovi TaxID=2862509 RepID=UPI001C8D9B13|nr:two-component regulator propeller domain-containing protein [Paracrocinitomix mangrovi]UKN00167.1 histidine kinase [Paracrocinitomix mangrovi]
MKSAFLLFLCLLYFASYGQKYNFKNYNVEDGLAQSQINDINQDYLGYLWIGTESGLSRFNGLEFVNYSMGNGLPDNKIEKIFLDVDSSLWIGTPSGISKFHENKFIPYLFPEPQRVNDLIRYKDQLYIATNNGLWTFKEGVFNKIQFDLEDDLYVRSLEILNDDLLIGARDGLYAYNSKLIPFQNDSSFLKFNISDLKNLGGDLIISTYGDGLFKYTKNGDLSQYDIEYSRIRSFYADEDVILCSTINGYLEIRKDKHYYYDSDNGLGNAKVVCSFKDREGNYWLGMDANGILKFLGKSIISYSTKEGISSNIVMSIGQLRDSTFIFGTYGEGVTVYKEGKAKYLTKDNGLDDNTIWAVKTDSAQRSWIGTSRGVKCIENGKVVLQEITSQIDSKTRSICFIDDKYFFGGTDGLYVMSEGHVLHLEHTKDININVLCPIGDDLFIGSRNGLFLTQLSDNYSSVKTVEVPESNVYSLCLDRNNNLWIGTENGLFVRLSDKSIVPFDLDKNEFKSKTILGLIESENGDIWVSTMSGVYQINIQEKGRYVFKINHFGTGEGMVNLEANLNAIYEDVEGKIWVGTSSGLVRIDPSLNEELFEFKTPTVHFTGVRLFMENFDYDRFKVEYGNNKDVPSAISLPYDQNHLTFDFIGINLKNPESVLYEYRLSGANDSWSPISKAMYATYSDISPGNYSFEVRATNKSMKWSEIKSIEIEIRPPFWRTWWFIILSFILAFFLLLMVFQIRIRAIKQKQENEKLSYKNRLLFLEQQSLNASMNRHFIFNSLNSIQYFINSSDKLSANKYLSSFAKLIRKNLDSSTQNNFIVTLQEEVERIELYLTLEKMRFQEKFDYEINVSSSLDTEGTEIPSMILQPFVENSIIHGVLPLSKKGKITINIYEEFDNVVFEVIDDGVGIDNALKNKKETMSGDHESKGMEITSRRIELLRKLTGDHLMIIGPYQINNEKGESQGTKVIIKMTLHMEE